MMFKINDQFEFVRVNLLKIKIMLVFSLILNVGLGLMHLMHEEYVLHVPHYIPVLQGKVTTEDIKLNDSSVFQELYHHGCVLPALGVAQAKLESGNYTSAVAIENKNLFGIRFHRCDHVKGENRGFASYDSYRDNILCYIHVQNSYLKNIDGVYAEPGYSEFIKNVGKKPLK